MNWPQSASGTTIMNYRTEVRSGKRRGGEAPLFPPEMKNALEVKIRNDRTVSVLWQKEQSGHIEKDEERSGKDTVV